LEVVEGAVGAFFATVLAVLACSLIIFLPMIEQPTRMGMTLAVIAAACWLWHDPRQVLWMWRAVWRGHRPAALVAARCQRPALLPLRPIISLWWLLHFAMAGFLAIVTERSLGRDVEAVVGFILLFAYTYVANSYLLLAVSAFTSNERALRIVWHARILIDIGVVVIAMTGAGRFFDAKA
jgi:hypothetical protein